MKRLCQWILYGLMGWKKDITQEHPDKYIICLAPHTSNWDFIIGQLFAMAEGMHTNFLMKKGVVLLASRHLVQEHGRHPCLPAEEHIDDRHSCRNGEKQGELQALCDSRRDKERDKGMEKRAFTISR